MHSGYVANLSVILPTYNRDDVLCDTLKGLLDQTSAPLEIIVVDQSRGHDSRVREFLDGLIMENKIKYIYQTFAHANVARNRGVGEAKGDIVLILNDDIIVERNFIAAHMENYKDPKIAAVSGQVLEDGNVPTDKFPRSYYRPFTGWMHFPLNFAKRTEVINLNACNLSMRKTLFIESGGFDENFIKTYFDDTDLSLRTHKICIKKGLKTIHDPRPSIIHLRTPGGNRPKGINEYVIADRSAWMTWFYFFIIDFGIYGSWEILLRLKGCVFRPKNILRPYYLWRAVLEFIIGMQKALALIIKGRKLPFKRHADSPD